MGTGPTRLVSCAAKLWFWLALSILATSSFTARAATEIIVSPEHAEVPIGRDFLRALFTMRLRAWPDGTAVRIFVLADDNPVHDQFCREQLGMYPYVLRNIWDRLEFTGTGFAPTLLRSEDEMRRQVMATPGAIGYTTDSFTRRESDRTPVDLGRARAPLSEGKTP